MQPKGPMPPQEVAILSEIFGRRIAQCGDFADKSEAIAHTIGSYVCAPVAIFADLQSQGEDYQGMISEYVRAAKRALDTIEEASKRGDLSLRKMPN